MATNLKVTELDFDDIKSNLKAFLKQQTEFNDYDFDGSGMSVLPVSYTHLTLPTIYSV